MAQLRGTVRSPKTSGGSQPVSSFGGGGAFGGSKFFQKKLHKSATKIQALCRAFLVQARLYRQRVLEPRLQELRDCQARKAEELRRIAQQLELEKQEAPEALKKEMEDSEQVVETLKKEIEEYKKANDEMKPQVKAIRKENKKLKEEKSLLDEIDFKTQVEITRLNKEIAALEETAAKFQPALRDGQRQKEELETALFRVARQRGILNRSIRKIVKLVEERATPQTSRRSTMKRVSSTGNIMPSSSSTSSRRASMSGSMRDHSSRRLKDSNPQSSRRSTMKRVSSTGNIMPRNNIQSSSSRRASMNTSMKDHSNRRLKDSNPQSSRRSTMKRVSSTGNIMPRNNVQSSSSRRASMSTSMKDHSSPRLKDSKSRKHHHKRHGKSEQGDKGEPKFFNWATHSYNDSSSMNGSSSSLGGSFSDLAVNIKPTKESHHHHHHHHSSKKRHSGKSKGAASFDWVNWANQSIHVMEHENVMETKVVPSSNNNKSRRRHSVHTGSSSKVSTTTTTKTHADGSKSAHAEGSKSMRVLLLEIKTLKDNLPSQDY
ncbi:expressed unknown protein [Seminavis robusta]|uniref:Uncharacterized protein n=1 Tax=Seminavis robusta TaxID=568900 RepID=A0A9N8E7Z5_9STRA|nr:expressed unknown protein [Seminavis robusta]|eukprot:Sro609_g175040.1 n/a (544) ;mRNA; r:29302-30933